MSKLINGTVKAALAAGTMLALSGAANAATLVFAGGTGNLTAGQSNYANFDSTFGTISASSGTTGVYTGTTSSAAEPAFGDQGDAYYAVLANSSVTFSFGTGVGSFGFDLGSADDYNTLTVNFLGGGSQVFAGAQLNPPGPATGNQNIAATNGRVTIFGDGRTISSATFSSGRNSFEFDNIGTGAVPEPAAWALFILGFGVIGGALRRRSKVAYAMKSTLV